LRQILINLINNAINYSLKGSVTLRAKLGPGSNMIKTGNYIILFFEVEDTGPGIAKDDLNRIFDSFIQANHAKKSQEGTGLGLTISKKLVELLGGGIKVESTVGVGTTFRFTIAVEVRNEIDIKPDKESGSVIGIAPDSRAVDGTPFRILVVEDGYDNRELLCRLLRRVGFDVREAENGKEAVTVYQEFQPHLIWMDIRMPIMDGYEATKVIRSQGAVDNQPVIIALTASAFEEERMIALKTGCDDFVRKPFKMEEIYALMSDKIGVRYLYDTPKKKKVKTNKLSQKDFETHLGKLPSTLKNKLKEAAELSDVTMINDIINEIRSQDMDIATTLHKLAKNFEYEEILQILHNTNEK